MVGERYKREDYREDHRRVVLECFHIVRNLSFTFRTHDGSRFRKDDKSFRKHQHRLLTCNMQDLV